MYRRPGGGRITEPRREGMDALLSVAFHVHASIIDVKGGDPQRYADGDREDGGRPKELSTPLKQAGDGPPSMNVSSDGDPGSSGSEAEAKPQPEVATPSKTLHVRINHEGQHGQPGHHQGDLVQQPGADEQHGKEHGCKRPSCPHAHAA